MINIDSQSKAWSTKHLSWHSVDKAMYYVIYEAAAAAATVIVVVMPANTARSGLIAVCSRDTPSMCHTELFAVYGKWKLENASKILLQNIL